MKKTLSSQENRMREILLKKREEKRLRRLRPRNLEEVCYIANHQEEIKKRSEKEIRRLFPAKK